MAPDDDTQNAVRRILKERPPEQVPSGSEARLRKRLDEQPPREPVTRAPRPATVRKKKSKAAR